MSAVMNDQEQTSTTADETPAVTRIDPENIEVIDQLPSAGLLSFYDRLRARITAGLGRRGGKIGSAAAETLMLAPDLFMLLVRLALDKEVPAGQRALVSSALAYFLLPADLMPELVLGPMGFLDDVILAVIVLSQAFGSELEPYAERYWSGSKKLREVLADVLATGNSLVGDRVYGQLLQMLDRYGIRLPETKP